MASPPIRPPFDPAYQNTLGIPDPNRIFDVAALRQALQAQVMDSSSIHTKHPQYTYTDRLVPGVPDLSDAQVPLALWQVSPATVPEQRTWSNGRPVIYYVHGGGQVAGDRFFGVEFAISLFSPSDNVVFASPEYRRAPENRAPAAAHDVYAGLVYLFSHAKELNIDPAKIILYGVSGGAAVSAGAALLSRKVSGPRCCALVLSIPMLDDRESVSRAQFEPDTTWPGWMDREAWGAVLGPGDRSDPDGIRVAGRAENLSGLPPVFIDIGDCESMRDNAVTFASRIWKDGGSAELHVWPGVYHGSMLFEPDVPVSKAMENAQKAFLRKVLKWDGDNVNHEETPKVVL